MDEPLPIFDLLASLAKAEYTLMRKQGVRLRVEKVTLDGQNALCSATQVQRRLWRADLTQEAIVELCQAALSPLYRIGLSPLIRAHSRTSVVHFEPIDMSDPFLLSSAMLVAGVERSMLPKPIPR